MDALKVKHAVALGVAKYFRWRMLFDEMWKSGLVLEQQRMLLAQVPPELKEAMKQTDPVQYQTIIDRLSTEV